MNEYSNLVSSWMKAYRQIFPTDRAKDVRLRELKTWDNKPGIECEAKIEALTKLLKK